MYENRMLQNCNRRYEDLEWDWIRAVRLLGRKFFATKWVTNTLFLSLSVRNLNLLEYFQTSLSYSTSPLLLVKSLLWKIFGSDFRCRTVEVGSKKWCVNELRNIACLLKLNKSSNCILTNLQFNILCKYIKVNLLEYIY